MGEFDSYLKRCRLCASEHQLGVSLFGPEGVKLDLKSKIKTYLSINVCAEDELPNQLCYQCLYRVETFHSFKLTCIETDHTLRNWNFFCGGICNKHNASEAGDESTSASATAVEIVSTAQALKSISSNSTQVFPSVSAESVEQSTTNSVSAIKHAQITETAINSKQNKDHKLQTEVGDKTGVEPPCTTKILSYQKQPPNSSGKLDIVAIKKGRNIVRICDNDQDREPNDQLPSSDNNEVSHILLNMSGVGTISVTKFAAMGTKQMDVKNNSEKGGIVDKEQSQKFVIDSGYEDESDGLAGFDLEEISTMPETEDCLSNKSEEEEGQTFVVAELVNSESEHTEVDTNGSVHVDENEPPHVARLELQYPIKCEEVSVDCSKETRFACAKCNKTFAQKSYIKEHMKIHTGEKPYQCTDCGRCFRNNYMLKVHLRLHTGEKNCKCKECGTLFTEHGALVSHLRTHTGVKPFICSFCGCKFAQSPALKRHLRIHTKEKPYVCEHCHACFADRGTLRNHMRIHTGERPYSCALCGKSFVQRNNLQAHINTHTDERPFPCQVCGSSFRTKAHLVKHLSTIHRDVMKSVVTYMKEPKQAVPRTK